MRSHPIITAVVLSLILAGCGGGGGGSSETTIPHPPPPPGTNQGPTITSVSPASPATVDRNEQKTITIGATDPDSDPMTFEWSVEGGGTIQQSLQSPFVAVFTAPNSDTVCTVQVDVRDNHEHTTTANIVFNVGGAVEPTNGPPVISSVTANPESVAFDATSELTVSASDPDADPLSYVWFPDQGAIESASGTTASWRAPGLSGKYTVTVYASDGRNPAVSSKVTITVGDGTGTTITNGLRARYIRNSRSVAHPILSEGSVVLTRTDPTVNFDWDRLSPIPELITDQATGDASDFGVRWTGHILCDAAGTYFFRCRYDDGVRLLIWTDQGKWVTVIDGWNGGPNTSSGSVSLEGGKWYPIRVDYFEDEANAYVQLYWTPPGATEQVVPTNKLRID